MSTTMDLRGATAGNRHPTDAVHGLNRSRHRVCGDLGVRLNEPDDTSSDITGSASGDLRDHRRQQPGGTDRMLATFPARR
jgi:hypothetical protein